MRLLWTLLIVFMLALTVAPARPAGAQVYGQPVPEMWGSPQFQTWPLGYYVWRDETAIHVRWTSAYGQMHRFQGQVRVEGQLTSFTPAALDQSGYYADRVWQRGNRIVWNATNEGGGEGFDFAVTPGDEIHFSLRIDGRMATRDEIFLGARAYHPSANPFAMTFQAVAYAPGRPVVPGRPIGGYPARDLWGAPQFQVWPTGYFVWMDENGGHLRWASTQGQAHRFRGEMTVQGRIVAFSPAYPDRTPVRWQGNQVVWNTAVARSGDGFDFTVNPGDIVQFSVLIDGRMARQDEVFLGARAYHPYANPFALTMRGQVGTVAPAPPVVISPVTSYPERDLWGSPQFQVWPTGYFIWMDEQGIHVRWTSNRGETHRFHGQATIQGTVTYFQPAYLGRTAASWQRGQPNSALVWDANNSINGDGFDFAVNQGDVVKLSLQIDGGMARQSEIFLGVHGVHPNQNPLWLQP